jgi:hypothetical protein
MPSIILNLTRIMSRTTRRTLLALIVALPLASPPVLHAAEPRKILMIGNSLTFCWGIPAILEHLATASDHKLAITAHVTPGMTLTWHWTNQQVLHKVSSADTVRSKRGEELEQLLGLTAKED